MSTSHRTDLSEVPTFEDQGPDEGLRTPPSAGAPTLAYMDSAYFRGGPKDGAVLPIPLTTTSGYLAVDDTPPPWARYKMTRETVTRGGVTYPVAVYVGTGIQPISDD